MEYIKPIYTRSQVVRAWKILIDPQSNNTDKDNALIVLNNWRSSHDYPMNTFQANIRRKIKSFRFSALVVERLKRTPSIIRKLERYKSMSLPTMQDIWWLRVVLRWIPYVNKLRDSFVSSKFSHDLIKENNYIIKPKNSGYRSLHLVYEYKNKYNPDYNGLQIEIQLRTEIQHIWATAVETIWIVLEHSLKSSEWPQKWLDFFAMSSSYLAIKEGTPTLDKHKDLSEDEIKNQLKIMEKDLDVIDKMQVYSNAIKFINTNLSKRKEHYEHYLLVLDNVSKTISVTSFEKWKLDKATDLYLQKEKMFLDEKNWQVVLVSWEWLKDLQRGYPNYFWDTTEFVKMLRNIIK